MSFIVDIDEKYKNGYTKFLYSFITSLFKVKKKSTILYTFPCAQKKKKLGFHISTQCVQTKKTPVQ